MIIQRFSPIQERLHCYVKTKRLAKQTKAESCFGDQELAIAFHIFVKLVAQTHSFMRLHSSQY